MALWQYSFFVLPKTALQSEFFYEQVEDGLQLFDSDPYWQNAKFPCNNFSELEVILPKGQSWSEELTIYGNNDSNCLKVFCEDGISFSVTLRIDFTTDYESVLRMLIEYFIRQELILLDQELHPVALNFESVKHVIESSTQVLTYRKLANNK
jgi:hypothetical protein